MINLKIGRLKCGQLPPPPPLPPPSSALQPPPPPSSSVNLNNSKYEELTSDE